MTDTNAEVEFAQSIRTPPVSVSNVTTTTSTVTVEAKPRKQISIVWNYFSKVDESSVRCKCSTVMKYNFNKRDSTGKIIAAATSNLSEHLKRCAYVKADIKKVQMEENDDEDAEAEDEVVFVSTLKQKSDKEKFTEKLKQSSLFVAGNDTLVCKTNSAHEFNEKVLRRLIVEMIYLDELAYSFVESEGFRAVIQYAKPEFKLLKRTQTTADCDFLYEHISSFVKKILSDETNGKFSLTSDLWTANHQNKGFGCCTVLVRRCWTSSKNTLMLIH